MSRRRFVLGAGASAAGLALGASGCALGASQRSFELGQRGLVRVINWFDYINPDLIPMIERTASMRVDYDESWEDNISGWERVEPLMRGDGDPGFDIVVPTNWLAARMVDENLLAELPLELIPNHSNLEPALLAAGWDRGARFNMPWQGGITGLVYNQARLGRDVRSIEELFNPELRGRVAMIGEMREAVGLAMLANGDDPQRATQAAAERALERVTTAHNDGQFVGWFYDDFVGVMAEGRADVAMAWSGQALQLVADNPDLRWVIPDEGAIRWFDTMVIPQNSPAKAAAAKWMNAVYDPMMAARITAYVGYISPVLGVRDELSKLGADGEALASNPLLFPDDATQRRLSIWDGLDQQTDQDLDDRFAALLPA